MQELTTPDTDTDSRSTGRSAGKDKCSSCGKPLGATDGKCFECGGSDDRGDRIGPEHWQVLLGVA